MSAYCTADDLYNVWGRENIRKWANVDNVEPIVEQVLDDRIAWAISRASSWIDGRLAKQFQVPFTDTVPEQVISIVERKAGLLLYGTPRGIVDGDDSNGQMLSIQEEVENDVELITAGQVVILATAVAAAMPAVVKTDLTGMTSY